MPDEKEILKKLLVDEKDILKNLLELVEKSKQIFVIEKNSGKILFNDFGKLSDPQRICAFLIGKYFAMKISLIPTCALGISEIGSELGRPMTTLSAPIKQLTTKGYVQKIDRKYEIAHHRIKEILTTYFDKKK